jgi:BMFP domain-containing protein YqiC
LLDHGRSSLISAASSSLRLAGLRLAGFLHHDKPLKWLEQSRTDRHSLAEQCSSFQEFGPMTQTSNRFFDEMARLVNDATGAAQGVKREFDTVIKHQAERFLNEMDLVKREEFEAVKEMARLAREENDALKARIAAIEIKLSAGGTPDSA